MSLSVAERAHRIATFRFVEVRLMEIAAAWTPTTPEMEVKVLLGRHIWDFAQHADALGKRTFELRERPQHSRLPTGGYTRLLDDVLRLEATAQRLAALYDAVLPGLARRYEVYLEEADPILDAPSFVVVDRILADLRRQRADAQELRRQLGLAAAVPGDLGRREGTLELVAPAEAGA
jgi:hypothetical protein